MAAPGQPGAAVTLTTDGTHVVDFRATDKAGLVTSSSQTVKIDKTSSGAGFRAGRDAGVSNGWYKTTVALAMSASDPASGVASFEYRLDGGAWTTAATMTLTDGTHTVDTRATDYRRERFDSHPSAPRSIPVCPLCRMWSRSGPAG